MGVTRWWTAVLEPHVRTSDNCGVDYNWRNLLRPLVVYQPWSNINISRAWNLVSCTLEDRVIHYWKVEMVDNKVRMDWTASVFIQFTPTSTAESTILNVVMCKWTRWLSLVSKNRFDKNGLVDSERVEYLLQCMTIRSI